MKIKQKPIVCQGFKLEAQINGQIIGRAFLYLMRNDLHKRPFGLMEDVWVEEKFRGQKIGTHLVQKMIALAKAQGCYKLIATSRHSRTRVHQLYKKLGFQNHGLEFRIDFS